MNNLGLSRPGICIFALTPLVIPAAADEPRTQRIQIEAEPPQNPEHQDVYDVLKQRRWLENTQEVYSVFKLPTDITIRTTSCSGVSNAWYTRGTVTICYEYLEDIRKTMPQATTLQGLNSRSTRSLDSTSTRYRTSSVTRSSMFGHPASGSTRGRRDEFAAYMMLQLDRDQAHRLIAELITATRTTFATSR